MKNKKVKKIGDVVEVEVTRGGSNTKFKIKGEVKEVRKSYGFDEYLITNGKVSDFYVRNVK